MLLGSASPKLVKKISESLAGRTGFLELGGISILEADQEPLWIKGAFPRLHWSRPLASPEDWLPAFLRTYLEQDIPQLGFRVSSRKMMRLLSMLAHSQGSICNLSELGGSLGIDYHSVSHIFEGTFLARRLPPYFANLGKRLVKSPKLYIRDTGILHHLLGIPFNKKALLSHPKVGASFEAFCIEQIINLARLEDPAAEAFFFRTQTGVEVDLLLRLRGELIPIEIKLSLAAQSIQRLERGIGYLGLNRGYIVHMADGRAEIRRGIWAGSLAASRLASSGAPKLRQENDKAEKNEQRRLSMQEKCSGTMMAKIGCATMMLGILSSLLAVISKLAHFEPMRLGARAFAAGAALIHGWTADKSIMPPAKAATEKMVAKMKGAGQRGWAWCVRRVFEAWPLQCVQCGVEMELVAMVTSDVEVVRILSYLEQPTQWPVMQPARPPPLPKRQ